MAAYARNGRGQLCSFLYISVATLNQLLPVTPQDFPLFDVEGGRYQPIHELDMRTAYDAEHRIEKFQRPIMSAEEREKVEEGRGKTVLPRHWCSNPRHSHRQ